MWFAEIETAAESTMKTVIPETRVLKIKSELDEFLSMKPQILDIIDHTCNRNWNTENRNENDELNEWILDGSSFRRPLNDANFEHYDNKINIGNWSR